MAGAVRATTAITTGTGNSFSVGVTTEAGDSDLVVFVFTSHGRTVSSSAYDGAGMTNEVADVEVNTTSALLRLRAAPGGKTANVTASLSGTANYAVVAYYLTGTEAAGAPLDVDSLNGNSISSALTLTSEAGGLVLSGMHSSPAGAMTFSGTEDRDGAGGTGQVGTGHVVASGASTGINWGTETTFAHVAISLAPADGGGGGDFQAAWAARSNVMLQGGMAA